MDGEPVSTAAIVLGSGVVGVYNVATLPGHQRRGYGEAVMRHALAEARRESGTPRGTERVVLVDDSIVRGTTSRKIVRMVRQAGAREVHLRISCPPTVSPCFYGVDTPTRSELIGSNHSVEEIRRFVEADSLGYLSLASLRQAVGDQERHEYCYACYTGDYPTELVNIEELISARQKRR